LASLKSFDWVPDENLPRAALALRVGFVSKSSAKFAHGLRVLDLGDNLIRREGVRRLAASPRLDGEPHRLVEVEFYYHGEGHPDPFAHRDPLTLVGAAPSRARSAAE
jgi:hypothetical protein